MQPLHGIQCCLLYWPAFFLKPVKVNPSKPLFALQIGVRTLALPSADATVDFWTKGLGFKHMAVDQLQTARESLRLMVFPGTDMLYKVLLPQEEPFLVAKPDKAKTNAIVAGNKSNLPEEGDAAVVGADTVVREADAAAEASDKAAARSAEGPLNTRGDQDGIREPANTVLNGELGRGAPARGGMSDDVMAIEGLSVDEKEMSEAASEAQRNDKEGGYGCASRGVPTAVVQNERAVALADKIAPNKAEQGIVVTESQAQPVTAYKGGEAASQEAKAAADPHSCFEADEPIKDLMPAEAAMEVDQGPSIEASQQTSKEGSSHLCPRPTFVS